MIFITRHFERIDGDKNNATINEKNIWFSLSSLKNPKNIIEKNDLMYINANPFSINHNQKVYLSKVISSIGNYKIDIIISSPFIRCIQTALKIKKDLKYAGKIHVNYGLAEFIDYNILGVSTIDKNYISDDEKYFLVQNGFNINKLFQMSLDNFNINKNLIVLDNTIYIKDNIILMNEVEPLNEPEFNIHSGTYFKRIVRTIESIKQKYPSKNILLVTHGYSPVAYKLNSLKYGDVLNITDYVKVSWKNYFDVNYLKNKFLIK